MSAWGRRTGLAAAAVGLAAAMSVATGVLGQPSTEVQPGSESLSAASDPAGRTEVQSGVAALQERLRRVPLDWSAWAELGGAYVVEAQRTADPSYYTLAEDAYAQSLVVRPDDNAAALTGQASLAAARHDFTTALELGQQAQALNPYSSTNQGALVDALVELGRYDEATVELQRMVDLRPDVASFTRVSYLRELRGDLPGAKLALEQAGRFAFAPSDKAFVQQYLGELAFNAGRLTEARDHYEAGLRYQPDAPRLLAGRARVAAAAGDTDAALRDYRAAVERLPEPGYLIGYAEVLDVAGRHEEAAEQYALVEVVEQLFRAQGANPDLELALYSADHGRPQAALELAESEWNARRSVHTEDAYAWALHVNGRDSEALEHARAAEALSDTNALFAHHRGMIELSLGMQAEAEASLARALEINPHFSARQAPIAARSLAELRARP